MATTSGGRADLESIHISTRSGAERCFAFAGLWDWWKDDKTRLNTTCIITTAANELAKPVHDRMPVIIRPEHFGEWLDPNTPSAQLRALLRPYPAEEMTATAVGTFVNSVRNEGPMCAEPFG